MTSASCRIFSTTSAYCGGQQGLRAVGHRLLRAVVDFDVHAVGAGGDAAQAIAGIRSGRPVAWLGSTMIGRWLSPLTFGHDRQVEHVAGRVLEAADAALAEDHAAGCPGEDVLGRHQQVLHRRAHAALEQHRLLRLADFLEQVEVLHVAGADLEHVGVLLDELDLARVHDLGDDRHVELVADARGGS